MTTLFVIIGYLCLLLALGLFSNRLFRGTSKDYFVASHSIGPFLLLMSVFGTTMTAFALVGSTGKSFERGIGTYGLMASISGLVHAAIFFLIGIRLWAFGKKHGFITQIQFDGINNKKLFIINEYLKEFCKINNYNIIKLDEMNYDLNDKDFYDEVHTTIEGSRKISNLIYKDIKKYLIE